MILTVDLNKPMPDYDEVDVLCVSKISCAVAREWSLTSNDPAYHVPMELAEALDALERATRESPLRKVKP